MHTITYLYDIIDDYKNADSTEEKNTIFKSFCSSIWSSNNKRRTYNKTIRFTVQKKLTGSEIGQILNTWSEVEYKGYKPLTKETDWCSLIRQKINNLYTIYFDREVILNQDYIQLLNTPKKLYYQWTHGTKMDAAEITSLIDDAMYTAEQLKLFYQKQKMTLSWSDYKNVIEQFLYKIFENSVLIEDYDSTAYTTLYDFMNEDNFYIRYFCKSLHYELLKWQKKYYGVRDHKKYKRCKKCGCMIENTGNKKMYCTTCAKEQKKLSSRISDKKYKNRKRENRNS